MTQADRPVPTQRAKNALGDALLHPGTFSEYHGELRIDAHSRQTVRDLLALLTGPVRAWQWTGDDGTPFRGYSGWLPCGLVLRIVTDAQVVPPVELPEGGGSDA